MKKLLHLIRLKFSSNYRRAYEKRVALIQQARRSGRKGRIFSRTIAMIKAHAVAHAHLRFKPIDDRGTMVQWSKRAH